MIVSSPSAVRKRPKRSSSVFVAAILSVPNALTRKLLVSLASGTISGIRMSPTTSMPTALSTLLRRVITGARICSIACLSSPV